MSGGHTHLVPSCRYIGSQSGQNLFLSGRGHSSPCYLSSIRGANTLFLLIQDQPSAGGAGWEKRALYSSVALVAGDADTHHGLTGTWHLAFRPQGSVTGRVCREGQSLSSTHSGVGMDWICTQPGGSQCILLGICIQAWAPIQGIHNFLLCFASACLVLGALCGFSTPDNL